jgi:hypothetical protein
MAGGFALGSVMVVTELQSTDLGSADLPAAGGRQLAATLCILADQLRRSFFFLPSLV